MVGRVLDWLEARRVARAINQRAARGGYAYGGYVSPADAVPALFDPACREWVMCCSCRRIYETYGFGGCIHCRYTSGIPAGYRAP